MKLLSSLLKRFVTKGTMRIYDAEGKLHEFSGAVKEPVITVRIHDKSLYTSLFLSPDVRAGEAYMDGTLTFEDGTDSLKFLEFFLLNRSGLRSHPLQKLLKKSRRKFKRIYQYNPVKRSRKNAAHHYDVSEQIYRLFLDKDMQYSCAYFKSPEDTLEVAQLNKKRIIAAKLQISDGMKILDIGCGWGGMALYLAQMFDVEVTGISLSAEQIRVARSRARALGLEGRVRFEYCDYREMDRQFDRIVSVGMLEHVGAQHLEEYFTKLRALLKNDGAALVHSIGRMNPPGATNPFIRKYIFPGGYVPSLSEIVPPMERQHLWTADCEIWRKHYHYTLLEWRKRFLEHWDEAVEIADERFCRMWEFYLTATAMSFMHGRMMVFHMLFSKNIHTFPMTRDFIAEEEARLKKREKELGIE
jgi:cyclopropane-fatty-acyl-phospholipid synthase